MLLEAAGTVTTYSSSDHVAVEGNVVGTTEEADEVALRLPDAGASVIGLACSRLGSTIIMGNHLVGCLGIDSCIERIAPVLSVAPLVTSHNVEVLCLEEVLVVLSIG